MQKISIYLYPNRIELLTDLPTFNVEYTKVYQKNIKIYQGVDNILEFDIKNPDQKRIDLNQFEDIIMNVMDHYGNALPNSPYTVDVTELKGIAKTVIPYDDLEDLETQYLKFSVIARQNGTDVLLYSDSHFGASNTIELITTAFPVAKKDRVYDTFTSEIDLSGIPIHHSSAIPTRIYEAIKTKYLTFCIYVTGFVGSVWLDATRQGAISSESFRAAGQPAGSWTRQQTDGLFTGLIPYGFRVPVEDYTYFRVSYQTPSTNGAGASFYVSKKNGTYSVRIRSGGTGYSLGSQIKINGGQLGGLDNINDLVVTVTGLDTAGAGTVPSSYAVSAIQAIDYVGTASTGTGEYLVTGKNYSGVVDKIIVKAN